ncbi:Essential protein Yae1, N terminal [Aspergillus nanangensis]|uniref:Protein YAE1 n=1 Tax=Aspergillus nanangensis TaxID=2582783 RepID=A0AAD4CU58_ASPNN|nr:Essential protein Yae1, N terminal [Aspergillus nanangensis]
MTSPPPLTNSLDDIFGSSPPHDATHQPPTTTTEPSELPSLRRQHVTAGYRDGVSASKGQHVQTGFDAGFPIGAQLGIRAGTTLGILEGILRGYESRASSSVVKKQPARGRATTTNTNSETEAETEARRVKRDEILKIYQRAVRDLDVQVVFAGLHESEGRESEKPEVRLARTGDAAVDAWEKRVMVAHWEENMDLLEAKEDGHTKLDKGEEGGQS